LKIIKVGRVRGGSLLSGALICAVLGAPVEGHSPEGAVHRAFQFPDHLVPAIDGDLRDWELFDPAYAIGTEHFRDLVSDQTATGDPADFSVRLMVGWNKAQNQLFVAARVEDDIHQIDRPEGSAAVRIFQDDAMEVFIDADHSGGQFANFAELSAQEQLRLNGAQASHFVIAGPPPDQDFFINFSAAAWYALEDGPYTRAAYRFSGTLGGAGVMNYELMLVPFDRIDMNAPFLSDGHLLQENQVIGFNAEFNDFDAHSELLDAKWSLSGEFNAFRFADRFSDLMLMPLESIFHTTAVESGTWGRIKASFDYRED
jgi:hypothetical protein